MNKITRRDFLLALMAAVTTKVVDHTGGIVIDVLKDYVRNKPTVHNKNHYLSILLSCLTDNQYIPASNHPLLNKNYAHEDDLNALSSAFEYLKLISNEASVNVVNNPQEVNKTGNLVCFGAPSSNIWTKHFFGYHGDGLYLKQPDTTPLRYLFCGDASKTTETCLRYEFQKKHEVPNWYIIDKFSQHKLFTPNISNNGFLIDDYLLITRMVNPFSTSSFVTMIAGTHGIGTKALEILVRDPNVSDHIALQKIQSTDEFQSLFHVGEVLHEHKNKLSIPLTVKHLDTFQFSTI